MRNEMAERDVCARTGMVFRVMRADDIPQVLALQNKIGFQNWTENHFLSEISEPSRSFCCVAEEINGTIAGYLVMMVVFDEAEILTVAVSPELRRHGIATDLLRMAWERFKNCDPRVRITRLEVRKSNLEAQAFYSRMGFIAEGVRKKYYTDGEDALLMVFRHDGV